MDYKTGSYIMRCRKKWLCNACKREILAGTKCLTRIKEYGKILINQKGEEYRHKTFTRYHPHCAKELDNLNDYERTIINNI